MTFIEEIGNPLLELEGGTPNMNPSFAGGFLNKLVNPSQILATSPNFTPKGIGKEGMSTWPFFEWLDTIQPDMFPGLSSLDSEP